MVRSAPIPRPAARARPAAVHRPPARPAPTRSSPRRTAPRRATTPAATAGLFTRYLAQRRTARPLRLSAAPADVVQLGWIKHGERDVTKKNGRAGKVDVEKLRGRTYAEGHNNPTNQNVFGWNQLYAEGHTLRHPATTHYNAVRMHLWNGRLGGPGDKKWNLAPGPAVVNSSMSAGPETTAKQAVDKKHAIWLTTEVWYRNDGDTANDFTNVVPNKMRMQWGYMLTNSGQRAGWRDADAADRRGDAVGDWTYDNIDQPPGAMTKRQKRRYRKLTDDDTDRLDDKLATLSGAEKVQVYELVTPALKKHMLLADPEVYQRMGPALRARALLSLSKSQVGRLLRDVLGITDARSLVAEIYQPLIETDQTTLLEAIFVASGGLVGHDEQLTIGKWKLIQALGDTARSFLCRDYRYLRYVPAKPMAQLLGSFSSKQLDTLLATFPSGNERRRKLNSWAYQSTGSDEATEWLKFINKSKVPARWKTEYRKKMKHFLVPRRRSKRKRKTRYLPARKKRRPGF